MASKQRAAHPPPPLIARRRGGIALDHRWQQAAERARPWSGRLLHAAPPCNCRWRSNSSNCWKPSADLRTWRSPIRSSPVPIVVFATNGSICTSSRSARSSSSRRRIVIGKSSDIADASLPLPAADKIGVIHECVQIAAIQVPAVSGAARGENPGACIAPQRLPRNVLGVLPGCQAERYPLPCRRASGHLRGPPVSSGVANLLLGGNAEPRAARHLGSRGGRRDFVVFVPRRKDHDSAPGDLRLQSASQHVCNGCTVCSACQAENAISSALCAKPLATIA